MWRVLIVDDSPEVLRCVERTLAIASIRSVGVTSLSLARQALDEEEPFDAVLIDVNIGAECGLDLVPDVRRLSPGTPPVLMTSLDEDDASFLREESAAFDVVMKPFTRTDLLAAVATAMQSRRRAGTGRPREQVE